MPLPKSPEFCVPLLLELERAGGSAHPSDIYDKVLSHFPPAYISDSDLKERQGSGREGRYKNLIQNARQQLKKSGDIEHRSDGLWPITSQGRQTLRRLLVERHHVLVADLEQAVSGSARLHEIDRSWRPQQADLPRNVRRRRRNRETPPAQAASRTQPPLAPSGPSSVSLADLITRHMAELKRDLASRLANLSADQFEELVAEFLKRLGYSQVRRVGGPGDRNIDVTALYPAPFIEVPVRVQVKHRRTSPNVGPTDVAAFRDRAGGADHLLLMATNAEFTGGAEETASEPRRQLVHLVDGKQLINSMIDKRIGVVEGAMGVLDIDDEFWSRF